MNRGDIYLVEMEPVRAGELGKTRPCIIVSHNDYNHLSPTVLVMPVTSHPPSVRAPAIRASARSGLDHDSSVLPLHIRAIAKTRLGKRIGHAPKAVLDAAVDILVLVIQ